MKRLLFGFVLILAAISASSAGLSAQEAKAVKGADPRFKADILVVVAHPDDEGAATPYLARALYDLNKKVAIVFATRGGSGGNDFGREHGPALALVREQEARQAAAKLGITNVWFLDGKDTASQNVLNSLSNWGHGSNLEKLVDIVRLTRPEVIMTWLPGVFVGENHGDHQAAGVLATEAFDLAGNLAAFPAQVSGDSKRLEPFLEGLEPWQPKKLYYFDDSSNSRQFAGTGPAYSVKDVSPAKGKPYWRLVVESLKPHRTQFGEFIQQLESMNEEQLAKIMDDPDMGWGEPQTFIFGKSVVGGSPTDDIFAYADKTPEPASIMANARCIQIGLERATLPRAELSGPWAYYLNFRAAHGLCTLPVAMTPEIAVKAGAQFMAPLVVKHDASKPLEVVVTAEAPAGWKSVSGVGKFLLPAESANPLRVEFETPVLAEAELKNLPPQEVLVKVQADGKAIGEARIKVTLRGSALPQ